MPVGPGDRIIFEHQASVLYEELVRTGGLATEDPRIADGADLRRAFDLLRKFGLVSSAPEGDRWLPVDPATVQAQVVAPLGQQGAHLIAESAEWARAFSGLSHVWRHSPLVDRGPFTDLRGEAIAAFVGSLVADTEHELLMARDAYEETPHQGEDPYESEVEALRRGASVRVLYQHSARRDADTRAFASTMAHAGGEVRTLDEVIDQVVVVDRRVAVIPGEEGHVVVIREPAVVRRLVSVFEHAWERGRELYSSEAPSQRELAAEQRQLVLRMLVDGRSDPTGAKRLGVSPRTYAGYVADLKEEFDAETRFQLGYAVGLAEGRDTPTEAIQS